MSCVGNKIPEINVYLKKQKKDKNILQFYMPDCDSDKVIINVQGENNNSCRIQEDQMQCVFSLLRALSQRISVSRSQTEPPSNKRRQLRIRELTVITLAHAKSHSGEERSACCESVWLITCHFTNCSFLLLQTVAFIV